MEIELAGCLTRSHSTWRWSTRNCGELVMAGFLAGWNAMIEQECLNCTDPIRWLELLEAGDTHSRCWCIDLLFAKE